MQETIRTAALVCDKFSTILNSMQSLLLVAIRLYWGWQFAQDGWGKLTHLARVTDLRRTPYWCAGFAQSTGPDGTRYDRSTRLF